MLPIPPMFAVADGIPIRYFVDDDDKVQAQYLRLGDGIWIDDFDFVYNCLQGRDGDDPAEMLKGELSFMPYALFTEIVAKLMRGKRRKA